MKVHWKNKSPCVLISLEDLEYGDVFRCGRNREYRVYMLIAPYDPSGCLDLDLRYAVDLETGIESVFDKAAGVQKVSATVEITQ